MADLKRLIEQAYEETSRPIPDVGAVLGAPDPNIEAQLAGQAEMGQERLGLGTRAMVGLGDTLREKQQIFNTRFPEGEIRRIPGTGTLVFREDPSKQFSPVDPKGPELGDLVDFLAEDAGPIIGETLLLIGSRGATIPGLMLRGGAGAVGGEVVEEAGEAVAGVAAEEPAAVGERAGAAGLFGAVGAGAGRIIEAPFRIRRGGGLLRRPAEAEEAIAAFERLGVPGPTPGQISDSPFIRRLEGQSGAVGSRVGEFVTEEISGITRAFQGIRDPKAKSGTLAALVSTGNRLRDKALSSLRRSRKRFKEAGPEVQRGIAEYDNVKRAEIDFRYAAAREIEEPTFDIAPLQRMAADLRRGVLGTARQRRVARDPTQELERAVTAPGRETVQLSQPETALLSVIDRIARLDPQVPPTTVGGRTFSSTDQLRALRSELFDLKTPPAGVVPVQGAFRRADEARAGRLFGEIDRILRDPQNVSPRFRRAWSEANQAAAERFKTMEQGVIIEAAKTETPVALARRVTQPGKFEELRTLRATLSPRKFKTLQEAFQADLLLDAGTINRRLDAFDPETLRILVSPGDERLFRSVGSSMERINRLNLEGIVVEQGAANAAVEALVRSATPAETRLFASQFRRLPKGRKEAIKAGLMDFVWNRSTEPDRLGRLRVNPDALSNAVEQLKDKELLSLIGRDTGQVISDVQRAARLVRSRSDAGTSILGAGIVRQTIEQPLRGNILDPLFEFAQIVGMGRFLTSKTGRRILVGTSRTVEPGVLLPIISAALAQAATDLESIEPAPPEPTIREQPIGGIP